MPIKYVVTKDGQDLEDQVKELLLEGYEMGGRAPFLQRPGSDEYLFSQVMFKKARRDPSSPIKYLDYRIHYAYNGSPMDSLAYEWQREMIEEKWLSPYLPFICSQIEQDERRYYMIQAFVKVKGE